MKKILVIDDTPENLEAAIKFFSTIPDFEFVYATNRMDAEKRLEEVFAVITDRSLPLEEDVSKYGNVNYQEEEMRINGNYLCLKSFSVGKPVVLISNHGDDALLGIVQTSDNISLKDIVNVLEKHEETHAEMLAFFKESNGPLWGLTPNNSYYNGAKLNDYIMIKMLPQGVSKKELTAWKAAWEELIKQF